jgi:hypothetical protein
LSAIHRHSVRPNHSTELIAHVAYRLDLVDNGEPGRKDTYRLRLSNGYDSGVQTLAGGKADVH